MKIHTLQIVNFKSYLGQHIIGPFDNHFSCIIGPNGNGKSNILDAMLFVFGFKSSKLRQDSLASLIHSSAYGAPQEAKVSVTFIDSQHKLSNSQHELSNSQQLIRNESPNTTNIPSLQTTITVSRTIRKNNYSFYQLNDKRIQWNQLRQFLLSQCIDLQKNLFIILQGQVERLCQLSPQKLVEYMEYVSGSDQFLQKINKLQCEYVNGGIQMEKIKQSFSLIKKVYVQQEKQGYELLDHIVVRIRLVELSLLEVKRQLVLNSQQLQVHKLQLTKIQQQLKSIQTIIQTQSAQLELLNKSLQTNGMQIQKHQQQMSKFYQQNLDIQSSKVKKLSSQVQYLIKDFKQKEKQLDMIEKDKNELLGMEEMEKQINSKAIQLQLILKDILINENSQNIKSQNKKNMITHNEQQINNQNNRKLRNKNNKKQQSGKKIQQSKHQQSPIVSSSTKTNAITHTSQYIKLRHILKQQQIITKTKLNLQTQFTKQLQQKQTQFINLKQHLQHLIKTYGLKGQLYKSPQELLSSLRIKLRQLTDSQQKQQKQLNVITQSLQEISRRISQTESQKSYVTLSQRIINQLKTANKYNILLPGKKLQTLRQLIHIPAEYSQLINSITPQLDFIIVQNHTDAKQVVNFLNSKKLGRLSLILMDQVKKIMQEVSTEWKGQKPKGCVRMIDVVKVLDSQYEKILYWTMGNTLIAQTVEDAMKSAYNTNPPYRVISKQGVFIDLSGTMTKVPLQSLIQQDRTLLDTRAKVLNKKLQQQTKKLSSIKHQKQQLNAQLMQLMNKRKQNLQYKNQQQFTSKQQLIEFMTSLNEETQQLQREIKKIKENKATIQLQVKLKQKQLYDLIKQTKLTLKTAENKNKFTFDKILQLAEEYENILTKLKKIQISQQLINSHNDRITKVTNQMQQITTKIQQKKQSISTLFETIKLNRQKISQIQEKKRRLVDENSKIQQKIFVKQLDVKYLKGQIEREVVNKGQDKNKKENNNRLVKNNKRRGMKDLIDQQEVSEMPEIEMFSGKKNIKNKNNKNNRKHNQFQDMSQQGQEQLSLLPSSSTILQVKKQQKRLSQLVMKIERKLDIQQKLYKEGLNSLRNIYLFLIRKCINDKQEQEKVNEQQQEKMKQMERDKIGFKVILLDYMNMKGLINENDLNLIQQQSINQQHQLKEPQRLNKNINSKNQHQIINNKSSQSSKSSHSHSNKQFFPQNKSRQQLRLRNIINSSSSQIRFNKPIQRVIFNSFFNSQKLINISPKDQYKFTDLLLKYQIQHIVLNKPLFSYNNNKNSNHKSNIKSSNNKQKNSEQRRIKQDLLKHINVQKINSLKQQCQQKLNNLQKNSSSLLIKSIHNSPIRGNSNIKLSLHHQRQQYIRQIDNQQLINGLSYFNDEQYPLNLWESEIIDSLIQKKNEFLSIQKQFLSKEQHQKSIYSQLLIIRQQRTTTYLSTFNMINIQVNKIYNFLTKGNAEINLINSISPFQGLQFSVRPFNKTWKSVNLLSGGQKTLTSLALIFACQQIKKFPFYFMDQIDAALDYRNVTNLGKYIKSKQNVQHIVISLRKNMYEQCDQLVCIYKVSDVTRTIVIGMKELYGRRFNDGEQSNQKQEKKKMQENDAIQSQQSQSSDASTITT